MLSTRPQMMVLRYQQQRWLIISAGSTMLELLQNYSTASRCHRCQQEGEQHSGCRAERATDDYPRFFDGRLNGIVAYKIDTRKPAYQEQDDETIYDLNEVEIDHARLTSNS